MNHLECKGNLVTHRITWSWYTGRWWVGRLLHLVQRAKDCSPPRPLLAVPNVTAHPSTASVPITVLLYNGPLLCGFNVSIKGLNWPHLFTFLKCAGSLSQAKLHDDILDTERQAHAISSFCCQIYTVSNVTKSTRIKITFSESPSSS